MAQKRILIIDDNQDILTMLEKMLGLKGYDVITHTHGEEVIDLLKTESPRALIMDMLLSGMDGRDLCRKIKQDESVRHVPVILFTAHPNAAQSCLDSGADHFLEKPFDMKRLLGLLEEITSA
ncbi:MAG: response regulator [Flavobacteriales bacterium]|nr:response regulator [Flavobacteriales bacterium]